MSKKHLENAGSPLARARTGREIYLTERVRLAGFEVTNRGLQPVAEMNEREWLEVGERLKSFEDSLGFLIGDWMAYGEMAWGKTYAEIAMLTGFARKTLYNYAYVCRKVQFSSRQENLDMVTFKHHATVAPLNRSWQEALLSYVAERGISVRQLQYLIRRISAKYGYIDSEVQDAFEPGRLFEWLDALLEDMQESQERTPSMIQQIAVQSRERHRLLREAAAKIEHPDGRMKLRQMLEDEIRFLQEYLEGLG